VTGALEAANKSVATKQAKIKAEVQHLTAEQCRDQLRKKKDDLTAALAVAEKSEVDQKGQLAALVSRQTVLKEQSKKLTTDQIKQDDERIAATAEK